MASQGTILEVLEIFADYYRREPSDGTVKLYMRRLSELDDDILLEAAELCTDKHTFFPRINEIRAQYELIAERGKHDRRTAYWQAMTLFNDCLAGDVTDAELERDASWKWVRRHGGSDVQEAVDTVLVDEPRILQWLQCFEA